MMKHVYFQQCILLLAKQINTMLTQHKLLISHYTKKRMKYNGRSQKNSELKRIVLRLGGLHICMSFLGSIGHFMSSNGLREVLETIYGSDTVPHMLSGLAIWRALGSSYYFRSALCNNNFWCLWMSIARSFLCSADQFSEFLMFMNAHCKISSV